MLRGAQLDSDAQLEETHAGLVRRSLLSRILGSFDCRGAHIGVKTTGSGTSYGRSSGGIGVRAM
jgi:hypothetical protein